jgi:CheY-like chemotaxis protein
VPAAGQPERGNGELVLLVEDEQAMREVTRRILARNGYQVVTAANGRQALTAAAGQDQQIAALVTDVIMPGMQGKELADRIRELQPGIAVLFMSGYTQGLLSAQGILEPGISLIEKPFNEASLLRRMRDVLDAAATFGSTSGCWP